MRFTLGMDVGYNGLKLSYGDGLLPKEEHLPAGAGPLAKMPSRIESANSTNGIDVTINGVPWVAGVDPMLLEGWERELHADYPSTDTYKALFFAALIRTGKTVIDTLVTGLPVEQALNIERRKALEVSLKGVHEVNPGQHVEVKEVIVLPQPVGAYLNLIMVADDPEAVRESKVVVIDPGFYSTDWVAIIEYAVRKESSGTSKKAMSRVLERASALICEKHGEGAATIEKLERAIHHGKDAIFVFGERTPYKAYIDAAASEVAPQAMSKLREQMREDRGGVDIVLMPGGGAHAFEESVRSFFKQSKFIIPENPVMAISRGFYFHGSA